MKTFLLSILLSVLFSGIQAQFKISSEYRMRSEYKDGLRTLSDESTSPALVSSQRARLNLDYEKDALQIYLSVQDVRVWGEIPHKTDVPSIALHQAYAKYQIDSKLAVKLGRQMLTYDNKYLLGAKNWNNVAVAHDIALLQYKANNTEAHAGLAFNNESDVLFESDYSINFYKYLGVLWLHHSFSEQLNVSLLNYYEGYQKQGDFNTTYTRGTIGPFFKFSSSVFELSFAPYYQFGKSKNGQKVAAYFIHIEPSLKLNEKIKLTAGLDYLSGDDATNDNNEANTFSNPYGDGHAYYGLMDYFTNIEKNTKNGGLSDVYAKINFQASKKSTLHAAIHQFALSNNILDNSDPLNPIVPDKKLGTELDLFWKYKFYPASTLMLGYSSMFASETMEVLKGGDSDKMQHWLYVSIQFKPTLFHSENK